MKLSFYPGCSLEGMANDYARSITAVFKHLGIELVEIEDWSCCGATAAHSLDEMLTVALPARNIAAAEKLGRDLVSPCANCFNRLRFSQLMIRKKIYDVPWKVTGETLTRWRRLRWQERWRVYNEEIGKYRQEQQQKRQQRKRRGR